MPFVYLMLFALVCLQADWPRPPSWLTSEGGAMLVGTLVAASWLTAALMGKVLAWQLTRQPERRAPVLRRYNLCRRYHFIALLLAYLASLYFLGWGHVLKSYLIAVIPESFRADNNLPGFQLGLLAPFFVALIASWERFYQVEQTAHDRAHDDDHYIGKLSYLLLQVRHQFFIVLPPIVVMTLLQAMYLVLGADGNSGWLPIVAILSILAGAFITMPIFLRLFLGLRPLPPGDLRDRLENAARRLGFRYSNILIWNTRDLFANAMVTGFVPWIRYKIHTDRLIDELTPDEIEAVFGHEVGHIKHHHLFFYLTFFLTSVILLSVLWDSVAELLNLASIRELLSTIPYAGPEDLEMFSSFAKLGVLAAYMGLFFGYLSRRCERQADLFGAATVSTDVFISALEKVAYINGISRRRFSWLHPSINQRIEFLRDMSDNPTRVPAFHLSIRLMQWSLYGLLGSLLVVLWSFGMLDVGKLLLEF
ncbi:MAG: M48 family metalloprotease [Planctomycetes bacterium]|nr:M48 family metalloprotease [Planctomycetota bacterium]